MPKKKQLLLFALCSFLALSVCFGVLVFTVDSVEKSNSTHAEYNDESKTELSGERVELYNYLKKLTGEAVGDSFVKVNTFTDLYIDDSSIAVAAKGGEPSEKGKGILTYVKNKALPTVDGFYGEDYTGVFGKAYENKPLLDFSEECVEKCSFSVGMADENGNPVYDSGSGELIDGGYYFISLFISTGAAEDEKINALFDLSEKEQICKKFNEATKDVCRIEAADIALDGLKINAKINRQTDEIEYIVLEKLYNIKGDTVFLNAYKVFGESTVEFTYRVEKKFEYHYAGIRFSESAVTIEPEAEAPLSVSAVIEDDSEYTVEFLSSDTSVAVIDEMGYVRGIKESAEPVTITVKLTYLGKAFEDTCLVYVASEENAEGGAVNG